MDFDDEKRVQNAILDLELFGKRLAQKERPSAVFAGNTISCVVKLWLLGIFDGTEELLKQASEWLDQGIAEIDPSDNQRIYQLRTFHKARGLAEWMLGDPGDGHHWEMARRCEEAYWRVDRLSRAFVLKYGALDDYMMFACMTNDPDDAWQEALEQYELWLGPAFKEPDPKGRLKLRDYCYLWIRSNLHISPMSDADLLKAGRKVLRANLGPVWLDRGLYSDAASALKLIYDEREVWTKGADHTPPSARDAILLAYHDLPKSAMPPFVPPAPVAG
jgi:hypothetical protein